MSEYWRICVEEALDVAGLPATAEQINSIAEAIEVAHEMHSEANGYHHIPNPLEQEKRQLEQELTKERSLVHCRECDGRGRIYTQGPYHGSDSQCWKCRGKGKHNDRSTRA